ncbi:MAG: hypothetical protein IJ849_13210 [Selenomonadaceae bacterium]|nr:hypothetical protein [Selenomonadaceae bacterium]
MKKIVPALCLGVVMLTGGTCSATIAPSQLVLGGITQNATPAEVEEVYGAPRRSETEQEYYGQELEYEYGNKLEFKFINGKLRKIKAEDYSDAKTAAGIGLGADVAAVKKAYGEPDAIHEDKFVYYVAGDSSLGLTFEFEHGRVEEIACGDIT